MKLNTPIEIAWFALGKFTFRFAEVEDLLREQLLHYADGSHEISKILIDSARADALATRLKKIAHIRNQDIPPRLASALTQLGVLASVRNLIFHHGPTIGEDCIRTTTYNAKTLEKGEVFVTTIDGLHAMSSDLLTIKFILMHMFNPREDQVPSWSYKRPQSKTLRQPHFDSDRTFRHPQATSQE